MYYSPEVVNKFRNISIDQFYNSSTIPKSPNAQGNSSSRSRLHVQSRSNRNFSAQLPSYSNQSKDSKQDMRNYFKQVWRQQSAQPSQEQEQQPKKKYKKKKSLNLAKKAAEFSENVRQQNLNMTKSESFYKIGGDSSSQNKTKKKYLYQSFEQTPVWGQSSATLRQTSQCFNFPKDERFREKRLQSTDKLALQISIPSSLNQKSCSLGKGVKQYVHLYELKRNVENPPPGRYDISTSNLDDVLNISLGTQEKFFQIDTTKKYPGPGTYNTRETPGKEKKAFSLRGQLKRFYEVNMQKGIPSPDKYYPQPNNKVEPSRYENITFGKGQKTNFAIDNGVPGPGQYPCHSKFDKLTTNNRTYQILRQGRFGKNRQKSILNEVLIDMTNTDSQKNQTVSTAAFYTTEQNFHQQDIDQFATSRSSFLKGMAKDALDTCSQNQ